MIMRLFYLSMIILFMKITGGVVFGVRKESIEVEGVSVTLVKKFNENTPNIGRLYKLKKR